MNFIFDLDGTLIDSYPSIIKQYKEALDSLDIHLTSEYIKEYVLRTSSKDFFKYIQDTHHISEEMINNSLNKIKVDYSLIELLPNVKELLSYLHSNNHSLFVYTHRGVSTKVILENKDILKYFKEVIDSSYKLKRKPDKEGIEYLVNKYNLDKQSTYYVGDRDIDISCAYNSGVKSILYLYRDDDSINNKPDYIVKSLLDIKDIL